MDTDIKIIAFLIILGLPLLQYDFRLLIIIILIYFLVFPEKRNSIYNNLIKNENIAIKGEKDNNLNILYQEGNSVLKELKTYKKPNSLIYQSIKSSWKKFIKLSQSTMNNTKNTYQHHVFSTLVDQRRYILNQMSALIVSSEETLNLYENTLTKQRDLPLDTHIRVLIRKMITIFDFILDIVKNQINSVWSENTYTELSPVEWNTPQAYNQNNLDPII
jgi:hypothetical protein